MPFDVLRDTAKMAKVAQWLAKDEAERERARRDEAVTRYIRRFCESVRTDTDELSAHNFGRP